ncbi:N-acylethanolamine-hydrolyzing acid amidase-like [Dysidea avara]|uniref:N-acylethanolamine-hydrolyzing acid amidase-like n=1 Tax=Dysidea avara TaxID=196820 RepID=UPI0033342E1A
MRLSFAVIALLLLWVGVAYAFSPNYPMETFKLDLDAPPSERWNHILDRYNASVPYLLKYFKDEFAELEKRLVNQVLGDLHNIIGEELGEEIKGIAKYWNVDVGTILGINLMYEFRKLMGDHHFNITPNSTDSKSVHPPGIFGCVSMVAQDLEGRVLHGRILDWNLPNELRNASFIVEYVSNGSVIFTGINSIAGTIGMPTGISKKGFSLSINERSLGGDLIEDSIDALLLGGAEVVLFARQVLTHARSYDEALDMLNKHYLAAPVYYILAGSKPNEGAVITRDRSILVNLWQLNVSASVPDSWYLLETNYDHWKSPVPYDNRRMYGVKYLKQLGQNVGASMAGLLDVLFTWPLRNQFTMEVILMNPKAYIVQAFQVFNVTTQSPFYVH